MRPQKEDDIVAGTGSLVGAVRREHSPPKPERAVEWTLVNEDLLLSGPEFEDLAPRIERVDWVENARSYQCLECGGRLTKLSLEGPRRRREARHLGSEATNGRWLRRASHRDGRRPIWVVARDSSRQGERRDARRETQAPPAPRFSGRHSGCATGHLRVTTRAARRSTSLPTLDAPQRTQPTRRVVRSARPARKAQATGGWSTPCGLPRWLAGCSPTQRSRPWPASSSATPSTGKASRLVSSQSTPIVARR